MLGKSRIIDPRKRIGEIISGFKLVDFLGKGGCGTVYRAEKNSEFFALKLFDRISPDSLKEARRQERIIHPNVVRLIEQIDSPPGVVVELMSGGDLASRIGKYDFESAIPVVLHILEGLKAIHERGLAHRDMKPHNVLFNENDVPKIGDFGLAMYFRDLETRLKTSIDVGRGFSGTRQYMAPEQEFLGQFNASSDVYAVGRIFYELLVGRLPDGPDVAPSKFVKCPPELDKIIVRAKQEEISDRYANASLMISDLIKLCPSFVPLKSEPVVAKPESVVPFVLDVETAGIGLLASEKSSVVEENGKTINPGADLHDNETVHTSPKNSGKFVGDYRIIKFLGKGGFGTVYLAEHGPSKEFRAVKLFGRLKHHDAEFDIAKEARRQSRIHHPNVVRVFDSIDSPNTDLNAFVSFAIGMEYMSAGNLFERIKIYDSTTALKPMLEILAGLNTIHRAGLVHRDMKPHNVLFGQEDVAKISDFGLAIYSMDVDSFVRTSADDGRGLSGTPAYMAPEQNSGKFSVASDLFSAGAIFFEMLTHKLPSEASTNHPREVDSSIPAGLDEIIAKSLELSPNKRFKSAAEMRDKIADLRKVQVQSVEFPDTVKSVTTKPKWYSGLLAKSVYLLTGLLGGLGINYVRDVPEPVPVVSPSEVKPLEAYVWASYRFGNTEVESSDNYANFLDLCKTLLGAETDLQKLYAAHTLDERDGSVDGLISPEVISKLHDSKKQANKSISPVFSYVHRFSFDSENSRDAFVDYVRSSGISVAMILKEVLKYSNDSVISGDVLHQLSASFTSGLSADDSGVSLSKPTLSGVFSPRLPVYVSAVFRFSDSAEFVTESSLMYGKRCFDFIASTQRWSELDKVMRAQYFDSLDGYVDSNIDTNILLMHMDSLSGFYDEFKKKPVLDSSMSLSSDLVTKLGDIAFVSNSELFFESDSDRVEFLMYSEKGRLNFGVLQSLVLSYSGSDRVFSREEFSAFRNVIKSFYDDVAGRLTRNDGYLGAEVNDLSSSEERVYLVRVKANFTFVGRNGLPSKNCASSFASLFNSVSDEFFEAYQLDIKDGKCDGVVTFQNVDSYVKLRGGTLPSSPDDVSGGEMSYLYEFQCVNSDVRSRLADMLRSCKVSAGTIIGESIKFESVSPQIRIRHLADFDGLEYNLRKCEESTILRCDELSGEIKP